MIPNLEDLARDLVGDGGSPNLFFVTSRDAKVLALVTTTEDEAIEVALSLAGAHVVEDRQQGVVWTDPRQQRRDAREVPQ